MKRTVRFSYMGDNDDGSDLTAELSGDGLHLIICSGNSQQRYDGTEDTYSFSADELSDLILDLSVMLSKITQNKEG